MSTFLFVVIFSESVGKEESWELLYVADLWILAETEEQW